MPDFISPPIKNADIFRACLSLKSGWLVPGKYSDQFEKDLSRFLGVKDAFLTSSCTHSIQLALLLAGIGPGDEVLTSSMTWVAAPNAISWAGATPVFVDVDRDTYLMTPDICEKAINSKTKAIIVTHLYGQMCDVIGFSKLAEKYGIKIIEDAAHSLESDFMGYKPGQLSYAATFSFHAAKNITSGQGGALVIQDSREKVLKARRHGVMNNSEGIRVMHTFGGKFEMTDFQAALLIGQLKRISKIKSERIQIWDFYSNICEDYEIRTPINLDRGHHSRYQFVIEIESESKRNIVRDILTRNNIQNSIHFTPCHLEPFYKDKYPGIVLPNTEAISMGLISLPTHINLSFSDRKHITKAFKLLRKLDLV